MSILGSQKVDAGMVSRILPLASAMEKLGTYCNVIRQVDYSFFRNKKVSDIMSVIVSHHPSDYLRLLTDPPQIVVFEGVATPQMLLLQKILRRRNIKVVYDMCDALFLSSASLFGVKLRPGSFSLEAIIKNSDLVLVNGHYLFNFVRSLNKNTVIIPDPIDTDVFRPRAVFSDTLTLGWEGVGKFHYDNLLLIVEPLRRLSLEFDLRLHLVSSLGDDKMKRMFGPLEKSMDIDYGPVHWVPADEFPQLLSDFDIMLSPLQNTPWYNGKSALRVGIGMALGIPIVASPVGEQKIEVRDGINGYLAKDEEGWYTCLKKLIENEPLRIEMGKNGRKIAEKDLSLEYCSKRLLKLLSDLL